MRLRGVLLLFSLFSAFLSGCAEKEVENFTIGFSQCTGHDAWRKDMLRGMKQELAFYPHVSLVMKDAGSSSQKQIAQIRELLAAKPDLLIVSPNEAEPVTPVIEEAYQQGIPVVVVDRKTASSFYTAYVGGNNYEVGKTAGQYIGSLLKGRGKILELRGLPKSSPAIDRHRGFLDAIGKFPRIKVLASIPGDWEKQPAKDRLRPVLDSLPNLDLVFAHNDVMALAAHEVWQEQNQRRPLKIVGIDGLGGPFGGIQLVNDGILDATLLYPSGGEEAIRLAMQILQKKPFNKENILNTAVIDSSNARMIKMQTDKIRSQQEDIERQQERNQEQIDIYRSQQVFLYFMSALLFFSVVVGALALYSVAENKKINKELQARNAQVLTQRNQIQEMAEAAQAATESKLKFFTNISHEFRTPLTLILSPIESLLQGKSEPRQVQQSLQLIQKNAQRLLWLVNQLMDFRKLEGGKMQLKAAEHDLIPFIRESMLPFKDMAARRHIGFELITRHKNLMVWFDSNMMEKVLFNLLSNAFKFVGEQGRIQLLVDTEPVRNLVHLKVQDTGIGMSEAEAARAFELFYQANHAAEKGTGLGLPLSKEIIGLHHGTISLTSAPQKGTTVAIALQLGQDHFAPEEKQAGASTSGKPDLPQGLEEALPAWQPASAASPDSQHLLVIEDHPELSAFLQSSLQADYQVRACSQGQKGLTAARQTLPDLIICDLMLPDIDGLKVVAALKADLRTSHIPVIILTAKAALEQQIEGLQAGADLYLTKPFSQQYLQECIRSLLNNRQVLKAHFSPGEPLPGLPAAGEGLSQLDSKFLEDFKQIIAARLAEPGLSVDSLGREIGLSRVQLYRKVKALLGCNVNDYIQTMRLNKSCYLLQHSNAAVSEVAYQVGFSSATYFSTAFKAKFGLSPSEYRTQRKPAPAAS